MENLAKYSGNVEIKDIISKKFFDRLINILRTTEEWIVILDDRPNDIIQLRYKNEKKRWKKKNRTKHAKTGQNHMT